MAWHLWSVRISPAGKIHMCDDYSRKINGERQRDSWSLCHNRATDWEEISMYHNGYIKDVDGATTCQNCYKQQCWHSGLEKTKKVVLELNNAGLKGV